MENTKFIDIELMVDGRTLYFEFEIGVDDDEEKVYSEVRKYIIETMEIVCDL